MREPEAPANGRPAGVSLPGLDEVGCSACRALVLPGARFCTVCGAVQELGADGRDGDLAVSRREAARLAGITRPGQCPHCELVVDEGMRYCPRCGAARPAQQRVGPAGASEAAPPARLEGWFPDPFGRQPFRWWDGEAWSAYASDHEVQWDPVPFDEPAPVGVRGVGIAATGFVVGLAVAFAVTALLQHLDEPGGRATLFVLSELGLWSGLIGACVVVARKRGTASLAADFGLRLQRMDLPLGLAGLVGGRLAASLVVIPIVAAFPDLDPPSRGVYGTGRIDTVEWIALVAIVCIGAPFVEELFFRGLVQTRLVGRYGAVVGIGITSLLFGAAHLIGWVGPITFVYATGIAGAGVVLGMLRHFTGRLGPSIATHVLFNVQAVVLIALLN